MRDVFPGRISGWRPDLAFEEQGRAANSVDRGIFDKHRDTDFDRHFWRSLGISVHKRKSQQSVKPYQLEHLEKLLGGDAGNVQQFVGILLADLPAHVREMHRSLDELAWQDVSLVAHGIKVQLKYLAAEEAGRVAGWIEREAGHVSLEEIEVEVARLERMITDICTDLKSAYQ